LKNYVEIKLLTSSSLKRFKTNKQRKILNIEKNNVVKIDLNSKRLKIR
jgi:hypothetical protein